MPTWLIQLVIGIGLNVLGYLIMPKPKGPEPPSLEDFQDPTFEAGREVPLVRGTITVKSPNGIFWGEKRRRTRKVNT